MRTPRMYCHPRSSTSARVAARIIHRSATRQTDPIPNRFFNRSTMGTRLFTSAVLPGHSSVQSGLPFWSSTMPTARSGRERSSENSFAAGLRTGKTGSFILLKLILRGLSCLPCLDHVEHPRFRADAGALHPARLVPFRGIRRQRGVDLAHSFGAWFADVVHTERRLSQVHADVRAVAILRQTSYPATDESAVQRLNFASVPRSSIAGALQDKPLHAQGLVHGDAQRRRPTPARG